MPSCCSGGAGGTGRGGGRGAPGTGCPAALGGARAARNSPAGDVAGLRRELAAACDRLAATRPTAVNLFWALGRMRAALDEYIEEEAGHDAWILDDIAATGGDAAAVRGGQPGAATEVMVAYAYDTIARGNPLGFLGMVHVLEGTSVALALAAADRIQQGLGLPDSAFTYLRSHGTLDREHTAQFEQLVDAIDERADQDAIVHAARMFYRLYGDVFRGLPLPAAAPAASQPLPKAA